MPTEHTANARTSTTLIRERALALGFDAVGIAAVTPLEAVSRYEAWLAARHHGDMTWLASDAHRERRADPGRILPAVRSMVCVALCHPPDRDAARDERIGRVARYAAGEDYHRIMRDKLRVLQDEIERLLPGARALWYADTGAILERAWAERAGLGWTGKHSGLLSRERGSWFLLGEVLVDRALEPDLAEGAAAAEHCGACTRCIDVCPTHAIVAPYQLDARRCISYLTIEQRGPIPVALRPQVGDWIFGCDLCQEVCPWNRFAPAAREARLHARDLNGWTLERFLELDEPAFDALFAGSPIRRAGRDGFLRNVCVALGNRADPVAVLTLRRTLTQDASPLVRAHAAWALGRIAARVRDGRAVAVRGGVCAGAALAMLKRCASSDPDAGVREEARAALAPLLLAPSP